MCVYYVSWFLIPLDPSRIMVFYIEIQRDFSLIFLDLSRLFLTPHLPKHPSLTLNLFPTQSSASRLISFSSMILFLSFNHAFHLLWPNFWGFWKILGFSKLMRFLQTFWVGCCLNDLKCSCIASHLDFNNVSCILDVYLLCWNHVCW